MATTPRPKPYFLDIGSAQLDTLPIRLPPLFGSADSMFQYLFEDLRGVANDVKALTTMFGTSRAAGPIGPMGFPGQDGADASEFPLPSGFVPSSIYVSNVTVTNGFLSPVRSTIDFVSLATPAGTETPALAGLGAGNLSNGVYKYIVTFGTPLGQTNYALANLSVGVTVVDHTTNGQVTITGIPIDVTDTATSRKLYRTLVGGTGNVYLVATIADNTTTTYTDNVADATLLAANVQAPYDNSTTGSVTIDGARAIFVGTGNTFTNVGVGAGTLAALTFGNSNAVFGTNAGTAITSGFNNTLIGPNVGALITTGTNCTVVGYQAGAALTTADQATLYGYKAGTKLTSGTQNVFIGSEAGQTATTAQGVTAVGQQAFSGGTSATNSVFIGEFSGFAVTSPDANVMIGYEAGYTANSANATTTGANNTFVGHQSGYGAATQFTNTTAIGYRALVNASNQVALGNSAVTTVAHYGAEVDLSYTLTAPLTGATITMAAGQGRYIANPAGTIAALTITLPPTPVDGQITRISSTQIVTALTVNAPGGATVVSPPTAFTTAGAGDAFAFLYQASSTSWFPTA